MTELEKWKLLWIFIVEFISNVGIELWLQHLIPVCDSRHGRHNHTSSILSSVVTSTHQNITFTFYPHLSETSTKYLFTILSKVVMQNLKFAKSVWYTTLWPSIRCNVVSSQVIELFVTYSCLFTDTKIYVEHLDKYKVKENKVWVWVERESYHDSSIYFHHYSFGIW